MKRLNDFGVMIIGVVHGLIVGPAIEYLNPFNHFGGRS